MWDDDQTRFFRYKYAPRDSFEEYPTWRTNGAFNIAKEKDAILIIGSRNPDLLSKVDSKLLETSHKTYLKYMKPANDLRRKGLVNWSAITAPIDGWVDKVFLDIPQSERKSKFWDTIFEICRIKQKDPIQSWKNHINQLVQRCSYLNNKKYTALKFIAPSTDTTIGLPKSHIWKSSYFTTQGGISNVVNIPTEEVFTTPHKDKTEGVLTATKGEKFIHDLIKTDQGASKLGEVSLVPHSSPISQSGLFSYNTLIDENASCHIALGSGIKACLESGLKMSDEEFIASGGNVSLLHLDFMIGSEKMSVDGIKEDDSTETIMRKGEWVFKV